MDSCFGFGREVWRDGLRHGVLTAHSVILCFMFGPTGILSHMMTKAAISWWQKRAQNREVAMPGKGAAV
jgi:hypothetical protein